MGVDVIYEPEGAKGSDFPRLDGSDDAQIAVVKRGGLDV